MRRLSLAALWILPALVSIGFSLSNVAAQSTDYTTRIPVGTVQMFAGAFPDISTGWIPADGRLVNIADWPELYSLIGIYYGGDGVTNFRVPNLIGRAPVATGDDGAGGLTTRTLGDVFGAETHTLTLSEIPAHNHGVTDPGHTHPQNTLNNADAYVYVGSTGANSSAAVVSATSGGRLFTDSGNTGISIQNAGGGGAHNIMQPSFALNFMIWGGIPAEAAEDIVITVVVVFPTHTLTPTPTPTLTPTSGPSPTPTPTATPTGQSSLDTIVNVAGQEVLIRNEVRPGDWATVGLLATLVGLVIVSLVFYVRRVR